jgi:hypothetical protein
MRLFPFRFIGESGVGGAGANVALALRHLSRRLVAVADTVFAVKLGFVLRMRVKPVEDDIGIHAAGWPDKVRTAKRFVKALGSAKFRLICAIASGKACSLCGRSEGSMMYE